MALIDFLLLFAGQGMGQEHAFTPSHLAASAMRTSDVDRLWLSFAFAAKFVNLIRTPAAVIVAAFYPHAFPLFALIEPASNSPHFSDLNNRLDQQSRAQDGVSFRAGVACRIIARFANFADFGLSRIVPRRCRPVPVHVRHAGLRSCGASRGVRPSAVPGIC
ncbi:hypothetical protein [Noviherbaspirillum sp.]|uniref:hypothetical protein n=1 Tax=Noviherbaspirillum sp. TaxID=1926288 RepID=UPI002FE36D8C